MKTTLDLPDELMRAVKIRAAKADRKLKDVIAELIRSGLSREREAPAAARRRVVLPLVNCAQDARPDEEMTPDRVAEMLLREDAQAGRQPL
ncbi:MAG: antitoxin [Chloroflexota bacterium]|nr:antitoxin [Chloroflexota bacterium]